jgi:hypothetical protein
LAELAKNHPQVFEKIVKEVESWMLEVWLDGRGLRFRGC